MKKVDLINVYIQEVTRRLPEKMREDISLELRSTILDMLPDDFSKKDVHQVLEKLGNPAVLATRYSERPMYVIGPKFYDMYISILKLVLGIVAAISLVIFFASQFNQPYSGDVSLIEQAGLMLGGAVWVLFQAFMQVFFWVTFVFFILERAIGDKDDTPISWSGEKWKPEDLEYISYIPLEKKITKTEILFTLFWMILWVVIYFYATNLIGIYDGSNGPSVTVPIFNSETLLSYAVPVFILIGLEIYRVIHMAVTRAWTFKLAWSNALIHLAGLIVFIMIARDANLIHAEFAPYLAELISQPTETVNGAITGMKWLIVLSFIVSYGIDAYNGFKKANVK